LVLCFKVIRKIIQTWADRSKGKVGSKISTKFILTFALLVLIPTITLSIFSSLFFNISMKGWFNERVLRIAEQSNMIADAYYKEHIQSIKSDASTMGKEIDEEFNTIFLDLNKLNNFVYKQIKLRELTEAFIFRKGGVVLAKGGFTISTTPDVITVFDLIEADKGDVVLTSKRKDRVRALIKLQNIQNTYLSVGRFIDPQIIAQIQSVNDESMVYKKLYEQRNNIQTNFYMVFILISLLILFGFPTKPSSFDSGIISMMLFFLVFIEIASVPFFFRESTISLLKSISTFSTIFIIFSSVTLNPLINLD